MTQNKKNRFWLAIPAICLILLDATLTLWGQDIDYWAGNYSFAIEYAPHAKYLLQQNPLWFILGILFYILFIIFVLTIISIRWSKIFSLALIMGHTWGASSWLLSRKTDYWFFILIFLGIASMTILSFEKAERLTKT